MVKCGLRVDEVDYPTLDRLRWSSSGDCWLLEVQGKNTKGGGKKTRDAWVPESVAENINGSVASVTERLPSQSSLWQHRLSAGG